MDNFGTSDSEQSSAAQEEVLEENELSHSDKMIGIISEPGATFESIAKYPPKTADWLIPLVVLLAFVVASQFLMMSNSEIYFQIKQKQVERTQKVLDNMVTEGRLTQEQANKQMNDLQDRLDKGRGAMGALLQSVGIIIFGFIIFFIVSGVYFLFSKFVLKGDGTYTHALVANGVVSYIFVIQVIIATILALVMGKLIPDLSVAAFTGTDRATFLGFVLAKLNPITIWGFAVMSIGLAKLFKSDSTTKYYVMVFGLWIAWGLIVFGLGKAVPFLQFLAG